MRIHFFGTDLFTRWRDSFVDVDLLEQAGFQFRYVGTGALVDYARPRSHYGDLANRGNITYLRNQEQLVSYANALTENDVCLFDEVDTDGLFDPKSVYNVISASPAILAAITGLGRFPHYGSDTGVTLRHASRRIVELFAKPRQNVPRIMKRFSSPGISIPHQLQGTSKANPNPRPLDFVWVGNTTFYLSERLVTDSTFIRQIHSRDYEMITRASIEEARDCTYLLFLDSMGPAHPDYLLREPLGRDRRSVPEYYALVGRALEQISSASKLPIVIAAHPRNLESSLDGVYGEFVVSYGDTANLVAGSRCVIDASYSTALGMAVVAKRPISLLTSRGFRSSERRAQREEAKRLALKIANMDTALDSWQIPEVNFLAYQQYVDRFMKSSGTREAPFWDQVAEDLCSRLR